MDNPVAIELSNDSLSILELIVNASFLVQLVMMILLVASVISWTMIFNKWSSFKALRAASDVFESDFWSGGELNRLYREWSADEKRMIGMANIFVAGYREYNRLSSSSEVVRGDLVDGVHRAMRVALSREIEVIESNLSFLATVGSTSPYIGLFGTVWGIMNSFRSLGAMQQVTIATVAPGISEALIATAMGLFAAIPAVIAYNRFNNSAERLINRYDMFLEEFLSIVNRQSIDGRNK
ncbi:MAG: biopolymer transport protein TolQ [Parasphingorhabdus sp.]|jgi:biopolymer transport protein TolQ